MAGFSGAFWVREPDATPPRIRGKSCSKLALGPPQIAAGGAVRFFSNWRPDWPRAPVRVLANADLKGGSVAFLPTFPGTPYRALKRLGHGGMGEVFLVVHEEIGRQLVLKLLHRRFAGDAQILDRVRVEAHSLAQLHQSNIVQVTDFRVMQNGTPFLVMEYLLGRTLKEALRAQGAFVLPDALDFVHQALSGLVAVHALGIVHRDIKPDNLFLSEEVDGTITLKVLDFGIARVMPGVSAEGPQPLAIPTQTGAVIGTPRYLSPEAALGKRVDHRADIYSLALVFYEVLAGRGPFEHLKSDFLTAHSVEDPAPPSQYAKHPIPAEVDAVVLRGLAKNPSERYQTAAEFQREVERLWVLLNNSQGLETTVLAPERSNIRTTGELRRQPVAPASASAPAQVSASVPPVTEPSTPAQARVPAARVASDDSLVPDSDATRGIGPSLQPGALRGTRPALLVASVFVALITVIAVTSAIVALLGRAAP